MPDWKQTIQDGVDSVTYVAEGFADVINAFNKLCPPQQAPPVQNRQVYQEGYTNYPSYNLPPPPINPYPQYQNPYPQYQVPRMPRYYSGDVQNPWDRGPMVQNAFEYTMYENVNIVDPNVPHYEPINW